MRRRAEDQHEPGVVALLAQRDQEASKHQAGQQRAQRQQREEDEQDEAARVRVLGREEEAEDDGGEDHHRADDVADLAADGPPRPVSIEPLRPQREGPEHGVRADRDQRIRERGVDLRADEGRPEPERQHEDEQRDRGRAVGEGEEHPECDAVSSDHRSASFAIVRQGVLRGPPIHRSRPVTGDAVGRAIDGRVLSWRRFERSDPRKRPASPRAQASPAVAGFLSFLFPGLGQLYVRRRRAAAVFAIPVLVLIVAVALQSQGGIQFFAAQLIDPSFALAALVVLGSLGLWRLASIGHAAVIAEPPGRRLRPQVVMVVLVLGLAVVIPHGVASYYAWSFFDAGTQIFQADAPTPATSPGPLSSAGAIDGCVALAERQRDLRVAADRPAVPDGRSRHLPPDRRGLGPRPGARPDRHDARRERRSPDEAGGDAEHPARHLELPAVLGRDDSAERSTRS